MFVPYEIIYNDENISIEVIDNEIQILTKDDYLVCTPAQVLDSIRDIDFIELKRRCDRKNESVAEVIKNWYLRGLCG